jgi:hypothetical protein
LKRNSKIILIFILLSVLCVALFFTGCINKLPEPGTTNITEPNSVINISKPAIGLNHIERTTGPIFINATYANYTGTLPVYRGITDNNSIIDLQLQQIGKDRPNVTSVKEAPEAARKALKPYGGLPPDAVYKGASITYTEFINGDVVVSKVPESTTVFYTRTINGLGLIGDSNNIILELGEDGELLWLSKVWRNYTYVGDVPVISLETAIDKLEREELIESSLHPEAGEITIDLIAPGYYAKNVGGSETILEPVWMFYGGNASTKSRFGFYVYARKFADFTAKSTTAGLSEEITFRSISDTSVTRRIWDFGDGTNSTLRNPVHTYQKPGKYTITLTAWNDMGSDSITKKDFITIQRDKTPDPDFTRTNIMTNPDNVERNQ